MSFLVILKLFYGWIDQGSEYDIVVEQSIYYNHGLQEIEEVEALISVYSLIIEYLLFCFTGNFAKS